MKLKDWLTAQEIRPSDFAERIGVEPAAVSRYCAGTRIPEREAMGRIVQVTNGEVTANDFYGIEEPAAISGGGADVVGLAAARLAEAQEGPGSPHPPAGQHLRVVTTGDES